MQDIAVFEQFKYNTAALYTTGIYKCCAPLIDNQATETSRMFSDHLCVGSLVV